MNDGRNTQQVPENSYFVFLYVFLLCRKGLSSFSVSHKMIWITERKKSAIFIRKQHGIQRRTYSSRTSEI